MTCYLSNAWILVAKFLTLELDAEDLYGTLASDYTDHIYFIELNCFCAKFCPLTHLAKSIFRNHSWYRRWGYLWKTFSDFIFLLVLGVLHHSSSMDMTIHKTSSKLKFGSQCSILDPMCCTAEPEQWKLHTYLTKSCWVQRYVHTAGWLGGL